MSEGNRPRAFPFYIVCDVSSSMWSGYPDNELTPFDVLGHCVSELLEELEAKVAVREAAWVSVITFADAAEQVLPLTRLSDAQVVPELKKGQFTNYAAMLRELCQAVAADCERLKNDYKLNQPAVFLLTDGRPEVNGARQPDHDWLPYLEELTTASFAYRPNIVTFGFGRASEATLCRIATSVRGDKLAYVADQSVQVTELLRQIMNIVYISIGASIREGVFLPDLPTGMRRAQCDAGVWSS